MSILELLFLSLSLAIDCFAVSCVIGIVHPSLNRRYILRYSFFFGLFQGSMPLIGWYLGSVLAGFVEKVAPFIAFSILAFIGGKMIFESFSKESGQNIHTDVRKFKNVILLSIATSIDALAVGFSIAMINENILHAVSLIGITSFIVSAAAYHLSKKILSEKVSKYAELVGGCVLVAIGLKIILL